MGIYIKGMKLPVDCEHCPFWEDVQGGCMASCDQTEEYPEPRMYIDSDHAKARHERCPLIEMKEEDEANEM